MPSPIISPEIFLPSPIISSPSRHSRSVFLYAQKFISANIPAAVTHTSETRNPQTYPEIRKIQQICPPLFSAVVPPKPDSGDLQYDVTADLADVRSVPTPNPNP